MILTIIAFLAVLSLIVFVHELGHYYTARRFGVKAKEFGFGMRAVDFQKLQMQGYDGILYQLGYSSSELFYGWDVNSVVVWQNQNAIKYIETKRVKDLNI